MHRRTGSSSYGFPSQAGTTRCSMSCDAQASRARLPNLEATEATRRQNEPHSEWEIGSEMGPQKSPRDDGKQPELTSTNRESETSGQGPILIIATGPAAIRIPTPGVGDSRTSERCKPCPSAR